jgi:hypothetical protein
MSVPCSCGCGANTGHCSSAHCAGLLPGVQITVGSAPNYCRLGGGKLGFCQHGLERAAPQRVGAGVEQGWASLAAAAGKVDPERAILVASGLPRSARNAGTCSVGATLGLYSKLMSERARLRGISLHSF